ncbi:MAG: hypothetical protein A3I88_02195 [Candidatus Portnoybacteria bacterium RIFCSPLOWO2_12_FULL_39_9]|uniref:Uncharacterized protein n=1 Tax=Candidatus Portnoybacteria bacterium RIFCSPHIGHO2_12_FULL_38_9 TaxID=1801997 RepID=A0A1G2FEJ8_9BACT|nr:MAG: hypothetical protein A3H00_00925 [Candidatus Portnoybacteria bacterium RBG_13_40_8]OGZ36504.1 MAG: hypothetical protein A3J64_02670 [Candidatus Portnoybacteria bacterium RIFCSPHIGHO2_12_FULL_38_9]OGZ37071.1 MAG: hypothetical protein A2646_00650 [Candidatus Portnoybacteria bacterium RIFCSPHIGHO2_02_FULL_39_12]OGZ39503.1 MAG: hypothetical protein A3F21_03565 [Candidatus Portnoybacteria bacterium RIFCSPLOWO2_01_FULL_38_39]OGZ41308.1 MAG: hypothetical protein A3I88_02195 [Candidatus Portnoy
MQNIPRRRAPPPSKPFDIVQRTRHIIRIKFTLKIKSNSIEGGVGAIRPLRRDDLSLIYTFINNILTKNGKISEGLLFLSRKIISPLAAR